MQTRQQNKKWNITKEKQRTPNSRFAKAGVQCCYENEVLNSNFVHLMKFSAKKTATSPSPKTVVYYIT
jgi:hypothetical protein